MDTNRLEAETLVQVRQIAEMKGITEQEAMAAVLNIYARQYVQQVERAIIAAKRAKITTNN